MNNYTLLNGIEVQSQTPNTFIIPNEKEKASLNIGDSVKIGLYPESGIGASEKFWVIISEVLQDGAFFGLVDNDLMLTHLHGYKDGDRIVFNKDHILNIWN